MSIDIDFTFDNGSKLIYREDIDTHLTDSHTIAVYDWQGEFLPAPFSHGHSAMLYRAQNALLKIDYTSDYSSGRKVVILRYNTYEEVFDRAKVIHAANLASKYTNKLLGLVRFPDDIVNDPENKKKSGQPAWSLLIGFIPNAMLLSDYVKQVDTSEEAKSDLLIRALNIGSKLYESKINFDNDGDNNILVDSKTGQIYFVDVENWILNDETEEEYLDYIGDYVKHTMI